MRSTLSPVVLSLALPPGPAIAQSQRTAATWLDETKPAAWNTPGGSIPAAPKAQGPADTKCRAQARPPQSKEDEQVRAQGWDLIGAYQSGWEIAVIRATAGYDGMCRPQQYQDFVFVKGAFAGTLAPHPMDSRADGSLTRVTLQGPARLAADYARYGEKDPLCCPSGTTTVTFEVPADSPAVLPVASTGRAAPDSLAGTSWRLVKFQSGDDTTLTPDDRSKYTIELGADGSLSARIDCHRGRGTWTFSGASQIAFGPMALTRAMCGPGSMHDQLVKQWSNIRSYVMKDGHLFLSLMADGGIYEFEPIPKP